MGASFGCENQNSKIADIKQLLALADTQAEIKKYIAKSIASLVELYPNCPFQEWEAVLGDSAGNIFYDAVVDVYDQRWTQEQVRQLIDAYQASDDIKMNPQAMMLLFQIKPFVEERLEQLIAQRLMKAQVLLKQYGYDVPAEDLLNHIKAASTYFRKSPKQKSP